ncbi:DnaJ domain [Arabidopsis thaliana x Arabidopsis arenosa]|uniref:DnaJ domain n=1 Tax=Arabidopsis thaliana x Arabidopsis arenosa TaxID=1240361 RepID=A0A8T1XLP1_9BRAS|nr:DnaJ domain [Arabidopsis thaliana x Arabidopsis arenosa]
MECNKEEAKRAMYIAEKKLSANDYNGAKKFINKAQSLYPKLDGLKQVLMMIHVYISASNKEGGESDWYGILGVDPLADDETVKKHYKNLALLLHPDKNRFNGAEGAFKLVLDAWTLLSDKAKRIAYDQKRKPKQEKSEPASCNKPAEPASSSSSLKPVDVTFSTVCNRCTTRYCQFSRKNNLNKTFPCPNCGQDSVTTNMSTEVINGRLFVRFSVSPQQEEQSSANSQATSKRSSRDDDANSTHEAQKLFKKPMTTTGDANSTHEAQRLFKNPMTTTRDANSTHEAQRLFKKPMTTTTRDANSTYEAQRLFKKPMTKTNGDANSTHEAQRLFKNP